MSPPSAPLALQLTGLGSVLDLPGLVRAPIAFGLVLAIGAGLLWRRTGLVERAIAASIDRPVSSLGYGVAAHLTIAFFAAYTASQLGQFEYSGRSLAGVGVVVGVVLLAVVAALGFTVVGSAVVESRWDRGRWYGLVVGALAAGVVALAEPLLAALVWLIVVSTGIGGPVRTWLHAAEDVETVRS